jgi:metallophosphoesterase superfamily enzyme
MDCDGALYWPEERVLVIADLHLEKGSSFATRGAPHYQSLIHNSEPTRP